MSAKRKMLKGVTDEKERAARMRRAIEALRAGVMRKDLYRRGFTHEELSEAARRVRETEE